MGDDKVSGSYRYVQRYRPTGNTLKCEVGVFISALLPQLGNPPLFDARGSKIACQESALSELITERLELTQFPECGVDFDLYAGSGDPETVSRFEFHVGTAIGEIFIDFFALQYARGLPPINDEQLVKQLIVIGDPFEAFLGENNNEFELKAKKRQNRIPDFVRPAIIRGLHYLGKNQVENLGGIDACLNAPASSVLRLEEGVLIRLVDGVFDAKNVEHLKKQADVMSYFEM